MKNFIDKYALTFGSSIGWSVVVGVIFAFLFGITHITATEIDNFEYEQCSIEKVHFNDEKLTMNLDLNCPFGRVQEISVENKYKFLRNSPDFVSCKEIIFKFSDKPECDI